MELSAVKRAAPGLALGRVFFAPLAGAAVAGLFYGAAMLAYALYLWPQPIRVGNAEMAPLPGVLVDVLQVAIIGALAWLVGIGLIGAPAWWALHRLGMTGWRTALTAGTALAYVGCWLVMATWGRLPDWWHPMIYGWPGPMVGLVIWRVAYRRPAPCSQAGGSDAR